jgi:tricarballylate dehydrogenase
VLYDAAFVELLQDEHGVIEGAVVNTPNGFETIGAASIVLAAGGFEASAEKRAKYLGKDWDVAKVRGSRFNTGEVLETALKYGAATTGEWSGCHATMVHASAPKVEMGQEVLFPLAYPYGIIVDRDGQRFTDEGADFYLHTYAALGRTILNLPGAKAFQIFDAKSQHLLKGEGGGELSYAVPHHSANTLGELAEMAGINPRQFEGTVDEFNSAIQAGDYDPSRLDGKRTNGLAIDKLNWAMALDTPPFRAYPVECGITFTYGGLSCTVDGQVLDTSGRVLQSMYAIGELAGTFYSNYVGGSGLTKGAVFGYRAGRHAGTHALQVRT